MVNSCIFDQTFVLFLVNYIACALIRESLSDLQAKLCNGKFVIVEARRKGFFSFGKQRVLCHNLVDLLRHLSRAFDNVRLSYILINGYKFCIGCILACYL